MARAELTPQEKQLKKEISATLNRLLEAKGCKKIDVVNGTGINNSTIYDYFNGKFLPTQKNVIKLAAFFHVKPEEIDPRLNPAPSNVIPINRTELHRIPVIGTIACGDPIYAEQNVVDYLELPGHLPDGAFALICEGDSMEPGLQDGDRVVIEPTPNVEDGEVAAVLVDGDTKATLKKVRHVGDTIWLMPTNPAYSPIVLDKDHPGRILGKKIQMIRYGSR